jgi:tetratricopeptide (TPR) repeat protein
MQVLREASGIPVSYAVLRAAGIEFPAIVASELELAGVPIKRTSAGARLMMPEPDESEQAAPSASETPRRAVRARGGAPRARATAALTALATAASGVRRAASSIGVRNALTAALAVAALAAILAVSLGGGATGTAGHPGHGGRVRAVGAVHHRAPARSAPAAPRAPAASAPTAYAVQLEAQAHNLLAAQRYGDAVPLLRRALAATGEQLGECLQPASLRCLTYAYALYDLGRALLLSGNPGAALPVLSRRLEIDNQRATVQTQLMLARGDVRATAGGRTDA